MLMGGGGSPVRSGEEKMADTLSPLLVYYIDDAARKLFEKHSLSGVQKSARKRGWSCQQQRAFKHPE